MVTAEQIKSWIEKGLPESHVQDSGDGHHFEAMVISQEFEGKNTLQRHRIVYEVLGDRMQSKIHALSLRTQTPAENK